MEKDFLSVHDLSLYEFSQILDLASEIKTRPDKYRKALKHKILAMIFQKPSLRTRMTFVKAAESAPAPPERGPAPTPSPSPCVTSTSSSSPTCATAASARSSVTSCSTG